MDRLSQKQYGLGRGGHREQTPWSAGLMFSDVSGQGGVRPVAPMRVAVSFNPQLIGIHVNKDRAVLIRTQKRRAAVGVALQDILFRVAKAIPVA